MEHAFDSRGSGTAGSQGDEVGSDEPPFWPDDLPGPYGGTRPLTDLQGFIKLATGDIYEEAGHATRALERGEMDAALYLDREAEAAGNPTPATSFKVFY